MGTVIRGILTTVPANCQQQRDLADLYGEQEVERLIRGTGVEQVHIAPDGQTTVDLAEAAAKSLMGKLNMDPSTFDGIIFFTQTADYHSPSSACVMQDSLGLPKQSIAFDVNLGCSAYSYGLAVCHGLLTAGLAKRLLLLVGDVIAQTVDPDDKATRILFGDGATATVLETEEDRSDLLGFDLGTDGAGLPNLMCPVGQRRYPNSEEYKANAPEGWPEIMSEKATVMNGNEVFTFTLREVPGIVERTLASAEKTVEDIDFVYLHQANKFIMDFLIKKIGLPPEKCPLSIDVYGNTSGCSPALTACHHASDINAEKDLTLMFIGFGVGYSWSGSVVHLKPGTLWAIEELE